MPNRLLHFAAAFSTMLGLALAVLWVRSYRPESDYVAWRRGITVMAQSKQGRLWLELWHGADPVPLKRAGSDLWWALGGTTNPPFQSTTPIAVGYTPPSFSRDLGFDRTGGNLGTSRIGQVLGTRELLAVPFWSLVTVTALVPALWLASWLLGRRRQQSGHCRACGYDLRASRAICPECGAEVFPRDSD